MAAKMALSAIIFCNMRNIWKTRPDSWTITIEQNVQFQVLIYHEKFQLYQIQNGRRAATSDRQIFSLTRFTQHFLCIAPKFMPYIHFTNCSDEFESGQDLDRN